MATAWREEVATGQRALLARRRSLLAAGARRVGWKVGAAIGEVEEAGGHGIVAGALTSATVLPEGGTYAAGDAGALCAETELLVRFGADVDPDGEPAAAWAAVDAVGVALELVDVARPPGGLRGIVAANAFHRAVVLGPWAAAPEAELGAASLRIGHRVHSAEAPYPDVGAVARDVARLLAADGERIAAGDVLLTGAVVHRPVRAGDRVAARIAAAGEATAAIGA